LRHIKLFVYLCRKRYDRILINNCIKINKMKNQETTINVLQATLSGIIAGAQQHFMHANINKYRGFNKLANRMLEENAKEMAEAGTFINRIIELGRIPDVNPEKWPVHMDIESQFKTEYEEQKMALDALNSIISNIEDDYVTKEIYQKYLLDEANHTKWLKQQIDLMESIGLQNYLANQI